MELQGVDDFERVIACYDECFEMENHERPVMYLTAQKGVEVKTPPAPPTLHERWHNLEWRLDCYEAGLANTHFAAEGFPGFLCNLGPDILTACLGSELEFAEGTSWAIFRVDDWSEAPPLRFQSESPYWQAMEKFLRLSAERGEGKWITATGDLHSNADALSALRGPQNLALDMIECPDEVRKRLEECMVAWQEMFERHCEIIQPHTDGVVTCWLSAAVRGKYCAIQNDFCCMVSPAMFREFFQDITRREAAYLDRAIYHWDGPAAIPHLDALCEIEELESIQWTPGSGQPPMSGWIDLLKQVQDRGKGLFVSCGANEVKPIMEALRPEGVIISTCVKTPGEAEALIKEVTDICAGNDYNSEERTTGNCATSNKTTRRDHSSI